jgi:hypothetical protein
MTKQAKIPEPPSAEIIEKVLMQDDLKGLTDAQRLSYYQSVCDTLGLNKLTKPFDYLELDGKLVLYAKKDATEQLRKLYGISLKITHRERQDSIYVVTAQATLPSGRVDESIGAVPLRGWSKSKQAEVDLSAKGFANAVMKSETKAKRRVTLSICGIGMLDESEIEIEHDSLDQRTDEEIAERRVRQATENATDDNGDAMRMAVDQRVTEDNYKDVVAHVGKAQGRILGRRVGDLEPPVIEWLYTKWRANLGPSATDDDMRLKKAIEFAYNEKSKATPADNISSKQAAIEWLRPQIEDMVMTEEQFCKYASSLAVATKEGGSSEVMKRVETGAPATSLDQLSQDQLLVLSQNFKIIRAAIETLVKPKVAPAKPKKPKAARGRAL